MAKQLQIGVITSTTRKGRVGPTIAKWFISEASQITSKLEFTLVDIAGLPLLNEQNMPGMRKYEDESSKAWSKLIEGFDGYIIVSAEYNHQMPAPIKNALDTLYHEWNRKVVGFVGYGSYGAESAIMDLRPLVSYLNMMPIREKLSISKVWEALDENGCPKDGYVSGDMKKFIDELTWWTSTLANGRKQAEL